MFFKEGGHGLVHNILSEALGTLLSEQIKGVPGKVRMAFDNHFMTSVLVSERTDAYGWIRTWIVDHIPAGKFTDWELKDARGKDSQTESDESFVLLPNDVEYKFEFEGARFKILKSEDDDNRATLSDSETSSSKMRFRESMLNISIWGKDRSKIIQFVEACRRHVLSKEEFFLPISINRWSSWSQMTNSPPRPIGSVILDEGVAERLLDDIQTFLSDQEFYSRTSIPWRRGYLLHGSPGNGKTSLVQAVASHLKKRIHCLSLSSDIGDEELGWLLRTVPHNGIVLLEDVDCAFAKRRRRASSDKITFSGLLNAIDGIGAGEGRLLFMTTNHAEKLDPALIRAGRVDISLEISGATSDKARRMFLQFFPKEDLLARRFGEKIQKGKPMCELQNWLLMHRDDPDGAVREMKASRKEEVDAADLS